MLAALKYPLTAQAIDACISPRDATSQDYSSITVAYNFNEWWMLENMIASFKKSGRKFVLVLTSEGHEFWIPNSDKSDVNEGIHRKVRFQPRGLR